MASHLEDRFKSNWRAVGGPSLKSEYKFHPTRKWRADFAHEDSMTLIEIEGGIWSKGRHSRGKGFEADCEKYLEAALLGWKVIRLTDKQLECATLDRIARHLERVLSSDCDLMGLLMD
jgi:very-short-patch-repair endonuclease